MKQPKFRRSVWERNTSIVEVNGNPTGPEISDLTEAVAIARWLDSSWEELLKNLGCPQPSREGEGGA